MGHYGQFENNAQAMASNINKMHIALCSQDMTLRTWQRRNGHNRTADNFVIYTEHFLHDKYFQILAVLSPEAHRRINTLLPSYINQAEQFHRLSETQLNSLPYFTNTNQIDKLFSITP
ncbi:type II toxin-antitoxin system YafO family toxin [Testudinibacter sp. P27/CKL/0425]